MTKGSPNSSTDPRSDDPRRAGVRRTAWTLAAIAIAVYVGFLLQGVLGK